MRRPIIFFLLAGLAASAAALVVYAALRSKDAEVARAMVKTTDVVVAAHDLGLGAKLDAGSVRLVRWPRDVLPAAAASSIPSVIGNIVKAPFVENEPIVTTKLFAGDKTAGVLPLLIPPGMRAMSVPVDEVGDISGFVLPHSRVDVLVALSERGGDSSSRSRSKIVLENIEVLAVFQTIEQKNQPQLEKVVTFLVTPEGAERLALASREGTLRLALRNYADTKIVTTSGSDIHQIMGDSGSVLASQRHSGVRQHREQVEVIRNGKSRQEVGLAAEGDALAADGEAKTPVAAEPLTPAAEPVTPAAAPAAKATTPPAQSLASSTSAGKTIDVDHNPR